MATQRHFLPTFVDQNVIYVNIYPPCHKACWLTRAREKDREREREREMIAVVPAEIGELVYIAEVAGMFNSDD